MKKYGKKILSLGVAILLLLGGIFFGYEAFNKDDNRESFALNIQENDEFLYLSDLDYINSNNWSYVGYGTIKKDTNIEGGAISLIVGGAKKTFVKGMGVHATGQITYDIEKYASKYKRFTSMVGVDASKGVNGSVVFEVLVSLDGEAWTSLYKSNILRGNTEAQGIDVNIEGYKYLRIVADKSVGGNSYDHAVLGNAKLVIPGYVEDVTLYDKVHTLEYYDNILGNVSIDKVNDNKRLILEREFVNKLGYDNIEALASTYPKNKACLDWILNNDDVLEDIVLVGNVNSTRFISVLADLYSVYKDELVGNDKSVYQKMMIGLASTYATDKVASALGFGHKVADYDYLEKFKLYKNLYDSDTLGKYKSYMKSYKVELMRVLFSDGALNDEFLWLNYYTKLNNYNQSVYKYVRHTGTGVGYNDLKYQTVVSESDPNYDVSLDYIKKYELTKYGVPFGDNILRYWMVIDKGGICWNQSRVFQALFDSIGLPTIGVYQPGHEAVFYYLPNGNGTGKWNIANNISGWGASATSWYGGNTYRTILNWGNKTFTKKIINGNSAGYNGGYVYLEQENLNKYDVYKNSVYLNLLANSYSDNTKREAVLNEAIKVNNINLDSYDNLINLYKSSNASSDDWYKLALKVIDNYTYYPMALSDLLEVINPYLVGVNKIEIDNKRIEALNKATVANDQNVLHYGASREIAKTLLNRTNKELVTFSFDGENASKIMFAPEYKDYDLSWHYSLDGGVTKSQAILAKEYLLSEEEVALINADNDILIYIDGVSQDKYFYKIDIKEGTLDKNSLYANDLENMLIGASDTLEWRFLGDTTWTKYDNMIPDLTGDKTLEVRTYASGTNLASNLVTYTFTEDNNTEKRRYIPISHLSIESVSTEATAQGRYAKNAIDGNYNTNWHSAWNGTDDERFIVIKLDMPVVLSEVEYVPASGGNGKIIDGLIEGSMDGENWFTLTEKKGLTYTNDVNDYNHGFKNIKHFEIDTEKLVTYVRITAKKASNGKWFTARMFNFYQDTTNNSRPTAGISYSTRNYTNGDVVATLTNFSSENIKITSAGGNTHTFTENGTFEFTFIDTFTGKTGSSIASVTWIDKTAPEAYVEYSTVDPTNKSVIATLKPNEDVTVLNNGKFTIDEDGNVIDSLGNILGYTVVDGKLYDKNNNYVANMNTFEYEFIQNGEFTFVFLDKAGNKGSATAKVTWIDTEVPVGSLEYDILTETNKDVTVTLSANEDIKVLNNNGSNKYTFTENGEFTFIFEDLAGNQSSMTAKVSWIDKTVPEAKIEYDKSNKLKAVVKIVGIDKDITFASGNGVYEFTKNGTYEIKFYDKFGNVGVVYAVVDWLEDGIIKDDTKNDENINDDDKKDGEIDTDISNNGIKKNNTVSGHNNSKNNTSDSKDTNKDTDSKDTDDNKNIIDKKDNNDKDNSTKDNQTGKNNDDTKKEAPNNYILPIILTGGVSCFLVLIIKRVNKR